MKWGWKLTPKVTAFWIPMLAGAGANLSVDRRSRRNRREFRVTRATCVSRSSRVSTPRLRSLRRGLANQPGLLRSVLRPGHWYAHSLFEAVLGARRSRCPYLRDSARFPIALRSTRRTPTPSRYTSRAHSHNGARRRPRDSTSRVRVPASSACGNGSPGCESRMALIAGASFIEFRQRWR